MHRKRANPRRRNGRNPDASADTILRSGRLSFPSLKDPLSSIASLVSLYKEPEFPLAMAGITLRGTASGKWRNCSLPS
jgi:hypothetical protein